MRIEKYPISKIREKYYALHAKAFPQDKHHIPAIVYLVYDGDEYKGFISGYLHDARTFYIQRTARGEKPFSISFAKQVWKHLEGEGFRYLLGQIETGNIRAIIASLKTGWTINGYFTDIEGKPYIRVIMGLSG